MARAIFISGPPGAGKTTIAAAVGQLLPAPIVEVDTIKVERYGTTARCDDVVGVFSEAGQRACAALDGSLP